MCIMKRQLLSIIMFFNNNLQCHDFFKKNDEKKINTQLFDEINQFLLSHDDDNDDDASFMNYIIIY